jgi:WD40 repeat protein
MRMLIIVLIVWIVLPNGLTVASDQTPCTATRPKSVVWKPDASEFAISDCTGVFRYDATTFELIESIDVTGVVTSVYQPDGALLAIATHNGVWLWDTHQQDVFAQLEGEYRVVWNPSGEQIAFTGLDSASIQIYDVETQQISASLDAPEQMIFRLIWAEEYIIHFVDYFQMYTWHLNSEQLTRYSLPFHVMWSYLDFNNTTWLEDGTASVILPDMGRINATLGIWRFVDGTWTTLDFREGRSLPSEWSVAVHPNRDRMAVASRDVIFVFDTLSLERLMSIPTDDLQGSIPRPDCPYVDTPPYQLPDSIAWRPDGEAILIVNACWITVLPVDWTEDD